MKAEARLDKLPLENLIADTAFHADAFGAHPEWHGVNAAIPSNGERAQAVAHDLEPYMEPHHDQCFINEIKHFCRTATRWDKPARAYLSPISVARMMVWLR